MNNQDALKIEKEKLHAQEPELLIMYTAQMHRKNATRARKLSPADEIAHAVMYITAQYANAIKKVHGGWTCGTHMNHVRTALSHRIGHMYQDEQLLSFIESCVDCAEKGSTLPEAHKDMAAFFLSIRPAPLVHASMSQWLQAAEQKD